MANKKCMVFETLGPTSGLTIQESQNTNEVRMTGVFGVCGIKNENRRIYSKENYGMMVENLQKVIATEGLLGELEHPNTMNINLNNVSHKIESIEMNEDGTITGTILLLNTAKGKDAKAIVEGGVPLYISSRGAGSIDESGHVTLSTIKTYDLVGTPGFAQAKLNLKANQTLECLNESKEDGNEIWVITEGDELLGDDEDKDKDKDNKSSDAGSGDSSSSEDNKEEKDNKEGDEENNKEDDKDTSDEDENNKNSQNTTMNDLKEAIDQLTEKVKSLEAELHVAQESLNSKDEEIKKLNETLTSVNEKVEGFEAPNYEKIENWVNEEFAPEFEGRISDSITSNVQTWVVEEFTETIQNWVVEQFAPEVQNWVCEEFAPEAQKWLCEQFAPEVQNWVVEEFGGEINNWITEEFAPEVQNWVCEEFAPVIEGWINEEYTPENNATLEAKINENVNAFMESQKSAKLSDIDALLESLENKDAAISELVKEQKAEDKFAGVYVVENMPAQYQPSWNALSEEKQNEIVRSAKAYDFTKEGVLEKFWESVDFNTKADAEKQAPEQDIQESYYSKVFGQMIRLRNASNC